MQRRQLEEHDDSPHALSKRQHAQSPHLLGQRLRSALQSHQPTSLAIRILGGEHKEDCSYGELNLASEALAEVLCAAKAEQVYWRYCYITIAVPDIQQGSTVAMCCGPSVAIMVAVVGALEALWLVHLIWL